MSEEQANLVAPTLSDEDLEFVTANNLQDALAAVNLDFVNPLDPIEEDQEDDDDLNSPDLGIFGNLDGAFDLTLEMPATNPPLADIAKYSGHAKGTSWNAGEKRMKEMFAAQEWVDNFQLVKSGSGWTDAAAANTALLSLEPGSPADLWAKVLQEKEPKVLEKWSTLSAKLVEFFGRAVTNADRAKTLRALKQGANERTKDYFNRVFLSFKVFRKGLNGLLAEDSDRFGAPGSDKRTIVEDAANFALDYVFESLFMCGLKEELVVEIITKAVTKVEEMVAIAEKREYASQFISDNKSVVKISAIEASTNAAPPSAPPTEISAADQTKLILSEVLREIRGQHSVAAASSSNDSSSKQSTRAKKSKDRDATNVFCHFCGVRGHYSSDCPDRARERAAGKWRATVHCSKHYSKEQWRSMPQHEKERGKYMVPGAPAPPPGLTLTCMFNPNGTGSAVPVGRSANITYAGATANAHAPPPPFSHGAIYDPVSEESRFAAFYNAQGNC